LEFNVNPPLAAASPPDVTTFTNAVFDAQSTAMDAMRAVRL
jgi:hypothetical protein